MMMRLIRFRGRCELLMWPFRCSRSNDAILVVSGIYKDPFMAHDAADQRRRLYGCY